MVLGSKDATVTNATVAAREAQDCMIHLKLVWHTAGGEGHRPSAGLLLLFS